MRYVSVRGKLSVFSQQESLSKYSRANDHSTTKEVHKKNTQKKEFFNSSTKKVCMTECKCIPKNSLKNEDKNSQTKKNLGVHECVIVCLSV